MSCCFSTVVLLSGFLFDPNHKLLSRYIGNGKITFFFIEKIQMIKSYVLLDGASRVYELFIWLVADGWC
jgi:hypothetical protein